jgi:bifunctional non-homologous end joining protein LigD
MASISRAASGILSASGWYTVGMFIPDPMTPIRQSTPFDDPDWIYEIKHDGFRALAVIEHDQCRFFSRKKHKLSGYQDLRAALVKEVNADAAILDGELVVVDHLGRSVFADMMQRRHPARYFAFDLLWLNGEDLRQLPLMARKEKLRRILPSRSAHVLYVDHSRGNGTALYRLACQLDLEGIVAKRADSRYEDNPNIRNWIKLRIPCTVKRKGGRICSSVPDKIKTQRSL